jgi:subtilisin family serine protease
MRSGRLVVDAERDPAAVAAEHARRFGAKVSHVYSHALKGYAATIGDGGPSAIAGDPRVRRVEPDGVATASATVQSGATWGLDRIDQRGLPLSTTYTTQSTNGRGVKAYIIDTGIFFAHRDFGGRATSGYDAVDGGPADDCNGHGTHVAGTTGGATWGVAKAVSLVAVRVLDCGGNGFWSGVIAGIDWVTGDHAPGQPAVANMSLSGGKSASLDDAVRRSIADGVSYSVAAGNDNLDACTASPARVAEAMTVGATDRYDKRASFSNYGTCVDWFAPGVGVTSDWTGDLRATNTISGTSMAAPHTAGVAALYLQSNPTASPATVRDALFGLTTKGIVSTAKTANGALLFTNY